MAITEFNKGRTGKIFETVKKDGRAKIVLKNNSPECVLLPPAYYQSLMDKLDDLYLNPQDANQQSRAGAKSASAAVTITNISKHSV